MVTKKEIAVLKASAKSAMFFVRTMLGAKPTKQQARVLKAIDEGKRKISIRSGHGCFAKGHPVMMYDGSIKPVEDVRVGDLVMGDDGTPRVVLELKRGREEMYRFTFNSGDTHIYNASHKLVLKGYDGTIEVSVRDWLKWPFYIANRFHPFKRYLDGKEELLLIEMAEPLGEGDYYGFTLNGNHRFLSGDFIVTRNTGKTTLLAWIVLWWGLFREDAKIPMTAPTSHQLFDLLLPEVRKWRERLPDLLKNEVEVTSEKVNFKNHNFAVARTARKDQPEALQGFHATNLAFIIDEASGIPQIIFEVAEGAMTGESTLVIMAANPTRLDGYFYDSHHKNRWMWECFQFNAEESENVSRDWIEEKKRQYGEDSDVYRVRVKGEFPSQSSNAVFTLSEVEDAVTREQFDDAGAEIWGIDIADYGDDRTVLVKRKGKWFYDIQVRRNLDLPQIAGWLIYEYTNAKRKPQIIFSDAIGIGSSLPAVCYDKGLDCVVGVKASNASIYGEKFENKRAEWYYTLKDVLADGKIPDNDELIGELMAQKYKISTRGRLVLIDKDEIRKELGRSPDLSDALALTCEQFIAADVEEITSELEDVEYERMTYGGAIW